MTTHFDDFMCPCCSHATCTAAGKYTVTSKNQQKTEKMLGLNYSLVKCDSCHHVLAHPLPTPAQIKTFYESQSFWADYGVDSTFKNDDWLRRLTKRSNLWERYHRAKRQLEHVLKVQQLAIEANIIDIGAGNSPFLYLCQKRGLKNLFALEPSKDVCDLLEKDSIITYPMLLEEFVKRTDLPKFDLIVISHTLEHVLAPGTMLQEIQSLLKPDGILYLDVPFMDHLRPYHQGLHFHFFNVDSIRELLVENGFEPVSVKADRFNCIEEMLISLLYKVYGRRFAAKGGTLNNSKLEIIHKWFWRPLKSLARLKINIYISSQDLVAVARPSLPNSNV